MRALRTTTAFAGGMVLVAGARVFGGAALPAVAATIPALAVVVVARVHQDRTLAAVDTRSAVQLLGATTVAMVAAAWGATGLAYAHRAVGPIPVAVGYLAALAVGLVTLAEPMRPRRAPGAPLEPIEVVPGEPSRSSVPRWGLGQGRNPPSIAPVVAWLPAPALTETAAPPAQAVPLAPAGPPAVARPELRQPELPRPVVPPPAVPEPAAPRAEVPPAARPGWAQRRPSGRS